MTLRALRLRRQGPARAARASTARAFYTRRDLARLALILRAKAIPVSLAEIKHYLDLYGDHGEGRAQQLNFVITRTDAAIAELEARRAPSTRRWPSCA